MKRYLLLLLYLSLFMTSAAKTPLWVRSLKQWVDSADIAGADSVFVRLPREGFTVYANSIFTGSNTIVNILSTRPNGEKDTNRGHLLTNPSRLVSVGLYYRGWGLAYSHDFSSYGDTDFSYSLYGTRYGLECRYHNSYSLHGNIEGDGRYLMEINENTGRLRTTVVNAYYVFQRNHFSLPAATSHTTIQRRSAGSWLAAFNYWYGGYHSYLDDVSQEDYSHDESSLLEDRISLSHINLGMGYGYNYVFGHEHCMIHGSLTPMINIWHRNRIYDQQGKSALSQDLDVDLVAHLHFVYNKGKFLTGFQCLFNYSDSPEIGEISITTVDWYSRLFIGMRF